MYNKFAMDFIEYAITFIFCIISHTEGERVHSAGFDLHKDLLTNYSSDVRPVYNDSEITEIQVKVMLISLRRLDEISGELVTGLMIAMVWSDVFLRWDPSDYDGKTKIEMDVTKIWRPALQLFSPSERSIRLGKSGDIANVYHNGLVKLILNDIFYTSCTVRILYYPFDSHDCSIWFSSPEYGDLLKFNPLSAELDKSTFINHALWNVDKTALYGVTQAGAIEFLVCEIHLKRRATFPVLNILTPIVILMFLNSMVFALPPESGERVGFSVTILLSITVYMSIISDKLPNSSKPTPILMYVLGCYLAQSAVICISTIITLRMYYSSEEETISSFISCFVRMFRCNTCKTWNTGKVNVETSMDQDKDEPAFNLTGNSSRASFDITWTVVSKVFDKIFLISNQLICFSIATVYACLITIQPFDNE